MRKTARERAAERLRQAANILAKAGHFGDDLTVILNMAERLEKIGKH